MSSCLWKGTGTRKTSARPARAAGAKPCNKRPPGSVPRGFHLTTYLAKSRCSRNPGASGRTTSSPEDAVPSEEGARLLREGLLWVRAPGAPRPSSAPLTCRPRATRCAGWWAAGSGGRRACPRPGSWRCAPARAGPAAACGGRRRARRPPVARTAVPGAPRAGPRSPAPVLAAGPPSGRPPPGPATAPAGHQQPTPRPAGQAALNAARRRGPHPRPPAPLAPCPPPLGPRPAPHPWVPRPTPGPRAPAWRMGADHAGPRAPSPPVRRPRGPRGPAPRRPTRPPPPPPRAGVRPGRGCAVRVCVCRPGCCAAGCECL